jgi:hypothetical protein
MYTSAVMPATETARSAAQSDVAQPNVLTAQPPGRRSAGSAGLMNTAAKGY